MKHKIVLIIFFCILTIPVFSDVIYTWDEMLINGKIIKIVLSNKDDTSPEMIVIVNSLGTFEIDGRNIFSYWITNNPEEDIEVYKKIGKHLSSTEEENIMNEYIYGNEKIIEGNIKVKIVVVEKPDDTINKKNTLIFNNKGKLVPANISGIILTVCGGVFITAGIPLVLYNELYNRPIRDDKYLRNPANPAGYDDYLKWAFIYNGVFAAAISSFAVGGICSAIGIPFIFFKKRNTVSLNLDFNRGIALSIAYRW